MEIEPGQHDVTDPYLDTTITSDMSDEHSLMQDHENKSDDGCDQPVLNQGHFLSKVIYDDENGCLVARTSDGQYHTYKYSPNSEDQRSDILFHTLHAGVYLEFHEKRVHELFEVNEDVRNDPKYQKGMDYFMKNTQYSNNTSYLCLFNFSL